MWNQIKMHRVALTTTKMQLILRVRLPQKQLEVSRITSSTPAASMPRLPSIEVVTATIGRLLRAITAVATACTCIVPACTQVPLATISLAAAVLGVQFRPARSLHLLIPEDILVKVVTAGSQGRPKATLGRSWDRFDQVKKSADKADF